MTWQNPNLWKKKTKDWCCVFWILKTQKEALGVFRTRICIVNAGGSIVAAYAKNIINFINHFSDMDLAILRESKFIKHSDSYSSVPTLSTPSVFFGSSRSWDTTSDHKIAKAAMKRDQSRGEIKRAIAVKRTQFPLKNNNGFRVAMS